MEPTAPSNEFARPSEVAGANEFARTQDALGRWTGGVSNEQLAAQITELAGHLNAANHRLLVLIAEFDRRGGWSDGLT
jgi:hypothetical protein